MVNKVILIGNVGVDPEVRTLESGAKVARVRLATTERLFDRQANETKEHTEWHTITLWRGLADVVDRYVNKGSQIYIEGRLRTREWTDKDNNPFNDLSLFAAMFFDKCTLGKMISKYIVLHEGDKCLMVLRPYQFYAVEEILDKVQNSTDNGFIWHTTGAGKTLTSFKAAQLVSELDGFCLACLWWTVTTLTRRRNRNMKRSNPVQWIVRTTPMN